MPSSEADVLKIRLLCLQLKTAKRCNSRASAARNLGLLRQEVTSEQHREWITDALLRALNPDDVYAHRDVKWETWTVRINAAWSLGYFGRVTKGTLTGADPDRSMSFGNNEGLWELWLRLPFAQRGVALPALRSPQWFVRLFSVYCLSQTLYPTRETAKAVSRLLPVLDDPDTPVRFWATHAIVQTVNIAAIPPLIERLNDPNRHVRRSAASSLAELAKKVGKHRDGPLLREEVRAQLIVLLPACAAPPRVQAGAALALGKARMDGVREALTELAACEDENTRRQAAKALKRIGGNQEA